ncbi:MAG: DUF5522 domain-containing protein, partial [Terracidiphilus sp.]
PQIRDNTGMEQKQPVTPSALAAEDFYFEDQYIVFTAAYHLKRGTCCGCGCRHCPYGTGSSEDATESGPCPGND